MSPRFQKGQVSYWKGKKRPPFSEEWRKNMSASHIGKVSSGTLANIRKMARERVGKKLSEATKKKIGLSNSIALRGRFSGNNSPNWKGGITPLTKIIRHCFKYRQWRSDVFTRDDYACQVCGIRSGNGKAVYLEADHYPKMFSEIFAEYKIKSLDEALACEEFWNINNGRTVCRKHNPRGRFR